MRSIAGCPQLLQQVQVSFLVTTHSCPCFYCSVLCVDVEENYGVSEAGDVFLVPGFLKGLIWISRTCILDDTTSPIRFDQAGEYDDKVRFICISSGLKKKKKKEGALGAGCLHQCHSRGTLSLRISQLGIQRRSSVMYCHASAGLYLQMDLFALHAKQFALVKRTFSACGCLALQQKTAHAAVAFSICPGDESCWGFTSLGSSHLICTANLHL